MAATRHRWLDAVGAVAIAAVALATYLATRLGRIYGNDGAMLAEWTAMPERAYHRYHNALYLPAARLVDNVVPRGWLVAKDDPLATAETLSALAAALGLVACHACCRRLGASRAAALFATALLACSPVLWFFAAAIEVHTLHFLAVSMAAWVALAAPWHRPVLATAITAAVFVVPCVSHQSTPVLGPGWIALVHCARVRCGLRPALRPLVGAGVALLAAVLLGHMLVQWRRGLGFGIDLQGVATTIGFWRKGFGFELVWTEVLLPFGMLLPVAAAAAARRTTDRWLGLAVLAIFAPLVGCVLWWGVPERGGYLLGPSALLAALAAAAWSGRRGAIAVAAALLCLAGQAALAFHHVRAFDAQGFQLADRVTRVRTAIGASGLLVSANDNAPAITAWLPAVTEVNLLLSLPGDVASGDWLRGVQPHVRAGVAAHGRIALERSYTRRDDAPPHVRAAVAALEAWLRVEFRVDALDDASWPIWRIEPR